MNIRVLPTDKPSRLFNYKGEFGLAKGFQNGTDVIVNQNIYITSDEEIKERDWFIHSSHGTTTLLKCKSINLKEIIDNEGMTCLVKNSKKIILTIDPDLFKDGVQAIDDEFLEWFVKNPSCENVELEKWTDYKFENDKEVVFFNHKIIIPKEEVLLQSSIDGEPIWGEAPKQGTMSEAIKQAMYEVMDAYVDDVMGGCTLRAKEWFEQFKINKI